MVGELVVAAGSEPFVFEHTRSGRYRFTRRTGGEWTAPEIVGPPIPSSSVGSLVATARSESRQVIAGYVTGTLAMPVLQVVQFAGNAWEPVVAGPVGARFFRHPAAMASLPGDRVAVAVMGRDCTASVAILERPGVPSTPGFATVPGVTVSDDGEVTVPVAVARGADGAVLELVYIAADGGLMHTRLVDEATWTWSTPASIPGTSGFRTIYLAAGP